MPVDENTRYDVQVEIMETDTEASNEYAIITLNGENLGACYPGGSNRGCKYINCSNQKNHGKNHGIIGNSTIKTNSGQKSIPISIQYSTYVSGSETCPINGTTSPGVARITLTPKSKYFSFWTTRFV